MATPESPYGTSPNVVGGGKPVRVHHLAAAKKNGAKLVMLTAYDAVTAQIRDAAGPDLLLVGDSIGNVMLGHDSTLPVELDEMVVATRSVARATRRALVVADLPFGTYEAGPEQALASAVRLMKAGANAVKLEGGSPRAASVRALAQTGIPVVGHLGFTPQSVNMLGGFRVQGRGEAADVLLADAPALGEAGAVALVLEMVPADLAAEVTRDLPIPTIGIGAGRDTDAQVLVWQDMMGVRSGRVPRFVKQFAQVGQVMEDAARAYREQVRSGEFPAAEHTFE